MPSGIVQYKGARGTVWRIRYVDAAGVQIQETIGAERDGVTRKQAEIELRDRLNRVEKRAYRRPKAITFRAYSETWFGEAQSRRRWKPNTVRAYRNALDRLDPSFGTLPLGTVRPRDIAAH